MNADAEKILTDKILLLQKYLKKLAKYTALSNDELLGNEDKKLSILHTIMIS